MNLPLVSVLIPVYNSQEYIRETLESVVSQTYKNIEIIIVDDGSTDNSLAIIQEFEKKYTFIKLILQENKGAAASRNHAFSVSKGRYIQYLDADDILELTKIEVQISKLISEDKYAIAFSRVAIFKNTINNAYFKKENIYKNYENSYNYLIDSWSNLESVLIMSWLTPRKLIEKAGGWNETLSKNDDGEFFARIVYFSSKLIFLEKSIAYYRIGNNSSLSSNQTYSGERSRLNSYNLYMDLVEIDLSDFRIKKALAVIYSAYIYSIYPNFDELSKEALERVKKLGFKTPIKNTRNICTPLYYILGFKNAMKFCKYIRNVLKK